MRTAFTGISRLVALTAVLASSAWCAGDSIEWLGSYREGLQRARETGKPILVEFRCEA